MKKQPNRPAYLPLLIVSIAVVLFSTAGIAAIKGWLPASSDGSGDTQALQMPSVAPAKAVAPAAETAARQAKIKARANGRCAECGLIVSIGEINGHDDDFGIGAAGRLSAGDRNEKPLNSTKRYEIIVRMADGSNRVIDDASPANWRLGARVIIIDGTLPSRR